MPPRGVTDPSAQLEKPLSAEKSNEKYPLTLPRLTFRFVDVRDGKTLAETGNKLMAALHRLTENLRVKLSFVSGAVYAGLQPGAVVDIPDGTIRDVYTYEMSPSEEGLYKLTWYAELLEDGLGGELLIGMYVDGARKISEVSHQSMETRYDGVYSGVWVGTLAPKTSVIRCTATYDKKATAGTKGSVRNYRFVLERLE